MRFAPRVVLLLIGLLLLSAVGVTGCSSQEQPGQEVSWTDPENLFSSGAVLRGIANIAKLPAETFAPGPSSGAGLNSSETDHKLPFDSRPVQGISAALKAGSEGEIWVMPDNGYGAKDNSANFLPRMYRVGVNFEAAGGGSGGGGRRLRRRLRRRILVDSSLETVYNRRGIKVEHFDKNPF